MQDDSTPKDNLIPYGYCHCGCGQKTNIAKQTSRRGGRVKGEPIRFIHGHNSRRDKTARFFLKVTLPTDMNGCWEWQGSKDRYGYGHFGTGDRSMKLAHRFAYELLRGGIPEGLHLDHLCRNRGCVNPWHLEPVTNAENVRRGDRAKLTMSDARDIRRRYNQGDETQAALADEFGVSQATVGSIIRGKTWRQDDAA